MPSQWAGARAAPDGTANSALPAPRVCPKGFPFHSEKGRAHAPRPTAWPMPGNPALLRMSAFLREPRHRVHPKRLGARAAPSGTAHARQPRTPSLRLLHKGPTARRTTRGARAAPGGTAHSKQPPRPQLPDPAQKARSTSQRTGRPHRAQRRGPCQAALRCRPCFGCCAGGLTLHCKGRAPAQRPTALPILKIMRCHPSVPSVTAPPRIQHGGGHPDARPTPRSPALPAFGFCADATHSI